MLDQVIRHPILVARLIAKRIREIPSKGLPVPRWSPADDFDRKYGVETCKIVQIVPTNSPNFAHGTRYQASGEAEIRWSIENCGMPHRETTFVDLGSGKGRVLIVAASYPFKRIIGIEYSAYLAATARRNLSKLGIGEKCEVIVADAADFAPPDGDLLAFLYNPFDSVLLKRVLETLARAQSGRIRLAYLGPGHEVIQACGCARRIRSGIGPTLYEIGSC